LTDEESTDKLEQEKGRMSDLINECIEDALEEEMEFTGTKETDLKALKDWCTRSIESEIKHLSNSIQQLDQPLFLPKKRRAVQDLWRKKEDQLRYLGSIDAVFMKYADDIFNRMQRARSDHNEEDCN